VSAERGGGERGDAEREWKGEEAGRHAAVVTPKEALTDTAELDRLHSDAEAPHRPARRSCGWP